MNLVYQCIMIIASASNDNCYIFWGENGKAKALILPLFTNLLKVNLITYHLIKYWQFHCYIVIYEMTHFLSQERGIGINLNIQKDLFHTENYQRKKKSNSSRNTINNLYHNPVCFPLIFSIF